MNRSQQGVSLLEVLVAIGIVTILLALGSPQLTQIRERAKQVKCVGQLHGITAAICLYATDYDGFGPAAPRDGTVTPDEVADGIPDVPVFLTSYGVLETMFLCPKDTLAFYQEGYGSSYMYGGWRGQRLFEGVILNIGSIPPSKMLLIGEGMRIHRGVNNVAYMDGHVVAEK